MSQCKNCFTSIDGRSVKHCKECNSPLHLDCAIKDDGALFCDVCFATITEKPKSKFGDFDLPEFIRRTYIETYRSCPYKFYLEVIKGHTMPQNEYTQVGADVHEIIEGAINGHFSSLNEMTDMLYSQYWSRYDKGLFKNKSEDEMWKRAIDSLETFYEKILPTINNVFAVEETIFTDIGDNIPDVRITMDLITEVDGELEMHDWKTGRVMVGQKLSSDLQAPLYIYSVLVKHKKPVKKFTFYYLQENKTRTFIRSDENPDVYICTVGKREYKVNIIDAIREVKSIFSHIKKGNFNIPQDTKKMYFTCKMCHLREEGLCAGAEEESWNQIRK